MSINWQDINSVNIRELDQHHKVIVDLTNRLSGGLSSNDIKEVLKVMRDYAEFHFAAEEKYFKEFNYPGTDKHIRQHRSFTDNIKVFEDKYDNNGLTVGELTEFLKDWWIGHINHSDMEYSDFLNQRGIY